MDINASTLIRCNVGHDSESIRSLKVKQLNSKKRIQTLIPILLLLCKIFGGLLSLVKCKPGRCLCWLRLLIRGRKCNVSVKCVNMLYCVSIISCGICVIHHRNTCRIVRYLCGILIETLACCHDREQPDKVFAH